MNETTDTGRNLDDQKAIERRHGRCVDSINDMLIVLQDESYNMGITRANRGSEKMKSALVLIASGIGGDIPSVTTCLTRDDMMGIARAALARAKSETKGEANQCPNA